MVSGGGVVNLKSLASKITDLFGKNGWKRDHQSTNLVFRKKQQSQHVLKTETVAEVVFKDNHVTAIILINEQSPTVMEFANRDYEKLLDVSEELYDIQRQACEWAVKYRKKQLSVVSK